MVLPVGSSKLVTRWIALIVAASLIAVLDGGWLRSLTALSPLRVFHGQLWRLVTWPLIETSPLSLLFTCAAIYKFGSELAVMWGDRRLGRFVVQIVVAAGVATCLIAALTGGVHMQRLGGWAVADVLVIAWARQFPERPLVLYGLVALQGQRLVQVTIAAAFIFAVFFGFAAMAPELAACAITAWYPRNWLRR